MKKIRLSLITFFLSVLFLPICGQNESINEIMDSVLINDSLAAYYGQIGNLEKAQEYAAKNMGINSLIGENSVPYAIATLKYVNYLYPSERDNDKELTNKGLKILKDSLGLKSSTYMKYLLEYAWRQYNYEQIQEAANIVQEVAEANYDGDEFYLGYLYYSYGHFLKDAGKLEEAKKYIQKAELFFTEIKSWLMNTMF